MNIVCDGYTARLEFYRTEGVPKGAVVICPGGGYSFLSPREAGPVAREFTAAGYLAFVLYYEVEKEILGDLPLRQLGKAVQYVRMHGAEYGIENKKILVCGFSAGGHLAASLGIHWNHADRFEKGCDLQLHKPDGMILAYPVITAGEKAHRGSLERLAGVERTAQERYSLEKFVDADAVPAYIWGTAADDAVPVENSLLLINELAKYQIPVEYHLFPYGVHGLSLATKEVAEPGRERMEDVHVARWMPLCIKWLDEIITGSVGK